MTTDEQLRLRALRILHDGNRHAPRAIAWAVGAIGRKYSANELRRSGDIPARRPFTARELSLGAGKVVSL